MGYIASDNIRIFPSSERTATNQSGTNWLTEYNLSSIVNKLLGTGGFVITPTEDSFNYNDGNSGSFEFNIKGYYISARISDIFKAVKGTSEDTTNTNVLFFGKPDNSSPTSIYAKIKPILPVEDKSFGYLEGGDGGSESISDDIDTNTLLLFTVNGGTATIPVTSRINLNNLLLDRANIGPTGTVNVAKGGTINNGGTININSSGNIVNSGAITNNGTITNSNKLVNEGTITSNGTINIGPTGTVNVSGSVAPTGPSGSIVATALRKVGATGTVIQAGVSGSNNLATLFKIDDGELQ